MCDSTPVLSPRKVCTLKASHPAGIRHKEFLSLIHIATWAFIPLKISAVPPCCYTRLFHLPKVCVSPHIFHRLNSNVFTHAVCITYLLQMGLWCMNFWGVHLFQMEMLLHFSWIPSHQFLPQSFLHPVRHLRLWITFHQGSVCCKQTSWTRSKTYSWISPTYSSWSYAWTIIHSVCNWNIRFVLLWILGCVGIGGNQVADAAARDVAI